MKQKVLDINGKSLEEMELSDKVFGAVPNATLLGQYVRVYLANQRQGTSSSKNRAEVSGTGKKPWRQKGLGRARVGSSRNPLWRHGGISHGPQPKSWSLSLPKKMKRVAMISALSLKKSKDAVSVLNEFPSDNLKTKNVADLIKNLKLSGRVLFVLDKKDDTLLKCSANIENLKVSLYENLNTFDVLRANNVLFAKDALVNLQEKYAIK